MTPAAVGFQCPACVRTGQKAVRQPRTTFGGAFSMDSSRTAIGLISINVLVWLAITVSGGLRSRLVDVLGLSTRGICTDGFAGYPSLPKAACDNPYDAYTWSPGFVDGAIWQPVTSLFTHVEPLHLGFNMLAVFFLAPLLEQMVGRGRMLAVYLISGLGGSLVVVWVGAGYAATVGASGCIFGLLGALVVAAVRMGRQLGPLLFWLGLNVAFTVFGRNISWEAHLGGFLGGVAAMGVIAYAPRQRRSLVQMTGLGGLSLLIVLGLAVRIVVA